MWFAKEKGLTPRSAQNPIAEAVHNVVVYHSHRLHESVADGGSDEVETALLEVLADRIGVWGSRGDALEGVGRGLSRASVDEPPDVAVEAAKFLLHFKECPRVGGGRDDLQFVADNTG